MQNEEKVFERYLDLPSRARTEIINEMQPADRCRFTRCSKLSNKEAKTSKNYIYQLEFKWHSKNHITLAMYYKKLGINIGGFNLIFQERSGNKVMVYEVYSFPISRELWGIQLDNSTDLFQYALSIFKHALKLYQNTIKRLFLVSYENSEYLRNMDLGIESLNNLEELVIDLDVDMDYIFSKLRKPLKLLDADNTMNSRLANYEQVYQVQDHLFASKTTLNYQQLSQLSAKEVVLSIGNLTEKDILRFIRSWQNGTMLMDIDEYKWYLRDSKFNIHKLLNLLRVQDHSVAFEIEGVEIKHYIEPDKSAKLWCSELELSFFGHYD